MTSKGKGQKGSANKHLQARINYLHQAATYLASRSLEISTENGTPLPTTVDDQRLNPGEHGFRKGRTHDRQSQRDAGIQTVQASSPAMNCNAHKMGGLSSRLSSQLRQVAAKSQARLPISMKHSACKRCNTTLVEGQTCTKFIENLSSGGRKPHANVLVLRCSACKAEQRFPVGATRRTRKSDRKSTDITKVDARVSVAVND
jgi:ribonuclease P protein subunit RPR2